MPAFTLVGLPEVTEKEAKDRVRSALINNGFNFPSKKITVNLSPADLPKEGSRFDLPIAIAILMASNHIQTKELNQYEFLGELSLSGDIKSVKGAIPSCIAANEDHRKMILSHENSNEISLINDSNTLVAKTLKEICDHINKITSLNSVPIKDFYAPTEENLMLDDIIGQENAKRALEISEAGGHNLLMIGPPGTGKTMLANRLITLLPPLTIEQALETTSIISLTHDINFKKNWLIPPFRSPHHSSSMAALVGEVLFRNLAKFH